MCLPGYSANSLSSGFFDDQPLNQPQINQRLGQGAPCASLNCDLIIDLWSQHDTTAPLGPDLEFNLAGLVPVVGQTICPLAEYLKFLLEATALFGLEGQAHHLSQFSKLHPSPLCHNRE